MRLSGHSVKKLEGAIVGADCNILSLRIIGHRGDATGIVADFIRPTIDFYGLPLGNGDLQLIISVHFYVF